MFLYLEGRPSHAVKWVIFLWRLLCSSHNKVIVRCTKRSILLFFKSELCIRAQRDCPHLSTNSPTQIDASTFALTISKGYIPRYACAYAWQSLLMCSNLDPESLSWDVSRRVFKLANRPPVDFIRKTTSLQVLYLSLDKNCRRSSTSYVWRDDPRNGIGVHSHESVLLPSKWNPILNLPQTSQSHSPLMVQIS